MSEARKKFTAAREAMNARLVERQEEVDLCLTSLACGEHVLLVGPPGTAKTLLADSLAAWLDARKFAWLLTKFSSPEELFGPLDLPALKEGRFRRVTRGKLPEAEVAVIDECFKGSSAILNTLLKILNERVFDGGDGPKEVPLLFAVAASNEWPHSLEGGRELAALFDRFLVRKEVRPVATHAGRKKLLWERDHTPSFPLQATRADVLVARAEAKALPWGKDASEAYEGILTELAREGVKPGDRRVYKAVGVAQAYAWLNGGSEVTTEDLEVLQHVLWDDPQEQPKKVADVVLRVANPAGMEVSRLLGEAEEILAGVNPRDLSKAIPSIKKLGEIADKLAGIKKSPRAEKARKYVADKARELKIASLD